MHGDKSHTLDLSSVQRASSMSHLRSRCHVNARLPDCTNLHFGSSWCLGLCTVECAGRLPYGSLTAACLAAAAASVPLPPTPPPQRRILTDF